VATGSHSAEELSECIISDYIYNDLHEIGERLFGLDRPE
jgi:hypothetical protein